MDLLPRLVHPVSHQVLALVGSSDGRVRFLKIGFLAVLGDLVALVQVVHRNGTVLTNFCVPRGPRFGGAAGRGPPRHAKIDFFVLCPHGPLRKYFRSVFSACTDLYENIFEAFFLPARTITKHF